MPLVTVVGVLTQNTSHHVTADGKMSGKSPDAPAINVHGYEQTFQFLAALNDGGHEGLF